MQLATSSLAIAEKLR